jgi:two-component system sensor histidine kinase UhpB
MINPSKARGSTIRRQLILASLFPIAAFGLLSILLITGALQNLTLNQAIQRDTALAQVAASQVSGRLHQALIPLQYAARDPNFPPDSPTFGRLAASVASLHAELVALDAGGKVIATSEGVSGWAYSTLPPLPGQTGDTSTSQPVVSAAAEQIQGSGPVIRVAIPVIQRGAIAGWLEAIFPANDPAWLAGIQLPLVTGSHLSLFGADGALIAQTGPSQMALGTPYHFAAGSSRPKGQLAENPTSGDQVVYAYAPVEGTSWVITLEEPWQALFAISANFEWVLAGLLLLGVILSMVMLSISIGRVIRPLAALSRQAESLGPGSIFRPLAAEGPEELQALTQAFNQMVIRLAEQQAALRQYAEKALLSQEEERQRISHELHDETVQELVGLLQRIELCRGEMEYSPEKARRRLDELKALAEQALGDLRRISNALRPSILQDLGLPAAIRSLCDDLECQAPELVCEFDLQGDERRLAPDLELAIFRVVQEALSNVRRHGSAVSRVNVSLCFEPGCVRATIQDDGPSFPLPDVSELVRDGHLGVAGMYERARLFGGELKIVSDPLTGTTVSLCMPVEMGIQMVPDEEGSNIR